MTDKKELKVGLVMPISPIEDCSADHWSEVKTILVEAVTDIEQYDVSVTLVSDADDIGVIQKRIIHNIYSSDVIICDVSCKNANVMFELGMRLAFDRPTVIIKDDRTSYSFDTQVIEHLSYPRDLRFSKMVEFKAQLARRVLATYEKAQKEPDSSVFLKNFGQFKVAELNETSVTSDKLLIEMVADLQNQVTRINNKINRLTHEEIAVTNDVDLRDEYYVAIDSIVSNFGFDLLDLKPNEYDEILNSLIDHSRTFSVTPKPRSILKANLDSYIQYQKYKRAQKNKKK
ncbi:hypothetical protein [Paenibacillus azoreducens]|uniref:RNA helicase n=1 Tax=Paenibacillus azoreducens TaxID=116718 RepID=A0A919YNV5_9BACL|nr:hypothetical protein [Paenibacillus azoreducens]GIO51637.1 hypothetical protein J34TS1_64020 [Paenibacillus azoreducens]